MRAVVSVIGKDMVGILAKVSGVCCEYNVNVIDVTQTVLQDVFAMTMLVDVSACTVGFADFSGKMNELGESIGLSIRVMHEDIFNSMHRI
ncbi:MAG: ACT domain-containing protein [Clostridia bacterium]|nr:ACT domain-containing protein [Clostridia bacterium]